MLLMECANIKKYYGNRLILEVENFKIYTGDRIGVVGVNGAGKTTLIKIMSQRLKPDEGWVRLYTPCSFVSQFEAPYNKSISKEMASRFSVPTTWSDEMSGGEKTRFKLAVCLSSNSPLIFADEPTSNVDMEGIELMEKMFGECVGALVLVTHDRYLLDKLCNKILFIDNGKIKIYKGNYSDFVSQNTEEKKRDHFEYEQYLTEKQRLENVIVKIKKRAKKINRTPKRMGISEARLHKMGGQKGKANLEKAIKNVEKRIEHLEIKEKPKKQEAIRLDIAHLDILHSKLVVEGKKVNKAFDDKIIFDDAEFSIYNGSKIALIGPNGCGKTTLLKMIIENEPSIKIASSVRMGYFSQDLNILDNNLTILENVMNSSIYKENFARALLARLLFKREEVHKKVDMLSGGERVKVSFAKILLQDVNLLLLDEPTNYLDIKSIEVVEDAFKEYDGTLIFVSHDRKLVSSVANHIMTIDNHKINVFKGNYAEYLESINTNQDTNKGEIQKQILVLENRLSEIIGKLSIATKKEDISAFDCEYHEVLRKLKRLKKRLRK